METIRHDYTDDAEFIYIYKALAHPERNGYVTPTSLDERLLHIAEAKKNLGTQFTWLCDNLDNDLKHAMGGAPNSEWVIDPEGTIVRRRAWSDADTLRADLEALIGPVDKPTTIADLDMPSLAPAAPAPTGIVPRIEKPEDRMTALIVTPKTDDDDHPLYAKLRVEATRTATRGEGTLYLRFMLDPLYNVHWNNLTDPIDIQIAAPEGVTITPNTLTGPKVDAEGDSDPREFLVDITGASRADKLTITARYFACNDDEGWCIPVTDTYTVTLERDPDAGSVRSANARRGQRRNPGRAPGQRRRPGQRRGPGR